VKEDDFTADEIRTFLHAVDRRLTSRVRVVIIGGSAAALAFGVTSTTDDIDTLQTMQAELGEAVRQAAADTGLRIPMRTSTVADVPHDYEDRLERHLPELRRLEVWVLEKHDLALSKSIRCTDNDRQQIQELHLRVGLSFDILVERFRTEVHPIAVGHPDPRRDYFLTIVEDLFGELKRIEAEKLIGGPR
jgi:hypothetical protein